jgi:hypothetical protein
VVRRVRRVQGEERCARRTVLPPLFSRTAHQHLSAKGSSLSGLRKAWRFGWFVVKFTTRDQALSMACRRFGISLRPSPQFWLAAATESGARWRAMEAPAESVEVTRERRKEIALAASAANAAAAAERA